LLLSVLRGDKQAQESSALKESHFTDTGLSIRLPEN
jgi:hypothetical protein